MHQSIIKISGNDIAYYDTKSGNQAVLFIHGNSLSADTFKNQFSDSVLKGHFRLIALDMLGYGNSGRSRNPEQDYTFNNQSNLIVKFIEELKLEGVILLGHSFGGNIAIEVAKKCNKIKALALLASPIAEKPMSQHMFLPHQAIPLFFKTELTSSKAHELSKSIFAEGAEIPEFISKIIINTDPLTRAYVLAPIKTGNYDDQLITLKQLSIPLAVFHGANDQLANFDYLQKTIIPGQWQNKVHIIENGGHMFFYENATDFNSLLERFINSI